MSTLLHSVTGTSRRRLLIVLFVIGVAVAAHVRGRIIARNEVTQREQTIGLLIERNQELTIKLNEQSERILALQAKVKSVQETMEAIVPTENTYNIGPDQSILVAGGKLAIGLIGSPGNRDVSININGMLRSAIAGDVVSVPLDASTICRVGVQSFDMFKATVTASCDAKQRN